MSKLGFASEVGIHVPCFDGFAFHESLDFAKDFDPVLMGSLLPIHIEADGVKSHSHAFMLQSSSHVGCAIHVSAVLKTLLVEDEISSERVIQISQSKLLDNECCPFLLRASQVADFLPSLHAKTESFEKELSKSLVNEPSLKISNLVFILTDKLLIGKRILMPIHILILNICNLLSSLLHDRQVVLIFPLLEVEKLVVAINLEKSIVNLGATHIPNLAALLPPLHEVAEDPLA